MEIITSTLYAYIHYETSSYNFQLQKFPICFSQENKIPKHEFSAHNCLALALVDINIPYGITSLLNPRPFPLQFSQFHASKHIVINFQLDYFRHEMRDYFRRYNKEMHRDIVYVQ
jgi:hypothetical protein